MIRISEDDVKQTLKMKNVLSVVSQAYRDNVANKIYAGDRLYMPIRGKENVGQWLIANSLNQPYFGSKFSSVFPGNVKKHLPSTISTVSLYSAETGELEALIDANYLTAIKTGASAAVATDLLAKKDATTLGIIGTGLQAFSQVIAIQEVRTIKKLSVFDISDERVTKFIKMIKDFQNIDYEIVAAKSADDCVSESEIVCTCTTSSKPVFDGNAIKAGTHINAIGSFTPMMQEIDSTTVQRSSKIVTEHIEGLWEAAGDIIVPYKQGLIDKTKVTGTVGELLVGKITARESDQEITLNESVGSGVLDIAIAMYIYKKISGK